LRLSYGKPADVFSFGILMWECWKWRTPYPDLTTDEEVVKHVGGGGRPGGPAVPICTALYSAIMQKCWRQDPTKRPSWSSIVVSPCISDGISQSDEAVARYGQQSAGTVPFQSLLGRRSSLRPMHQAYPCVRVHRTLLAQYSSVTRWPQSVALHPTAISVACRPF
jgi:hypothetical protein